MHLTSAAFLAEGTDCLCRRTICPVQDDHSPSTPLASTAVAYPTRGAWIPSWPPCALRSCKADKSLRLREAPYFLGSLRGLGSLSWGNKSFQLGLFQVEMNSPRPSAQSLSLAVEHLENEDGFHSLKSCVIQGFCTPV